MNIGILTMYYQNYNYGGQLQAYALSKILLQQENIVEQISFDLYGGNFLDKWIGRYHRNYSKILHLRKMRKALSESKAYNENRQKYLELFANGNNMIDRFNEFMANIPHTEYVNSRTIRKLSRKYDTVILGGDQIWNPLYSQFNYSYKHSAYFGKWVGNNAKIITYAVSGGKDVYSDREKRGIINNSKHIESISVREKNMYQLLSAQYGKSKNIELVVDPVFLLSSEQWSCLAKDYIYSQKYIFAYLLNKDFVSRISIKNFAQKYNFHIITIPHARGIYNECDDGFGDVQVLDAGPLEFIGLIKNADMVFTDSFHGTCFSLIFHKNFYAIENDKDDSKITTNERMRTVLELAGIKDRLIAPNAVEKLKNTCSIDYKTVDGLIGHEIRKSKTWLKEALKR